MAQGDPYTYVLVRQDIALEHQMVQACHAALEAGFQFEAPHRTSFLVLCSVADEQSLLRWRDKLEQKGIRLALFYEPDNAMGYSALATQALTCSNKRKALKSLPLLKTPSIG